MQISDLGEISGPVLLFGGPYSNLQASEALFARAGAMGIGRSARICTGDVVGYCAQPAETWALVRAETGLVVAGNVERQLGAAEPDCGCGFEAGTACATLAQEWYPFALAATDPNIRHEMQTLPDFALFRTNGKRYAVIHGGLTDRSRFLWSVSDENEFMEEIEAIEAAVGRVDGVVSGHSGISFQRDVVGRIWINAGVIGMPENDGRQNTKFAVLDDGRTTFHELHYDAPQAAKEMGRLGLGEGYRKALLDGCWPSEEVLPAPLRQECEKYPS